MLEVAEIFHRHGAAYRARYQLLPSQERAMQDIEACRTAHFGGHLKQCDHCHRQVYVYHSCRNRHCPKCHGDQTERWLAQQQTRLLPGPYFLVTFYLAGRVAATGLRTSEKSLRLDDALCRCGLAETGVGSALRRLASRLPGSAAHLDQGDALPSPRPSAGNGRRARRRRPRVAGWEEPGLLNA